MTSSIAVSYTHLKIKALEKMAEMLGYFKDIEMETEDMSETEKEVYGDG